MKTLIKKEINLISGGDYIVKLIDGEITYQYIYFTDHQTQTNYYRLRSCKSIQTQNDNILHHISRKNRLFFGINIIAFIAGAIYILKQQKEIQRLNNCDQKCK